ncbi:hypothetical protein [Streptomyces sp. Ncost-T10-10d]|uniref:hypothetical protein n=1 Tax=Streptomyces sp. Ncost-T10-10d TaxID=1839774 RepID=UPI00081DE6D7|nr:hypothetical protein [Streptomyces sp. Ncost-T10-10d]SCF91112.1 hypothetical protein GA0115254_12447 [Streptomyces sp. Ncost-T10-10d]
MTSSGRVLTALHLFLVWATMTAAVPALGFGLLVTAWAGGTGATAPLFALGVPLTVGLLATAGIPARTVVPLCGSVPQRLGWAVLVFVLGTLGVFAGLAAYGGDVDLGSASTRIALTGAPYAVAAAFFVPSRWVRLGAVAALAAGVAYGGFVGPAQSQQRQHEAEVARYREHPELLYLGAAPPGMRVSHAEAGPAYFSVEYRTVREDGFAYVGLTVRSPLTPTPRCPELVEKGVTCTVDAHGEMRTVRDIPGGGRAVTLTRRHRNAEAEVTSQTLEEPGLRHLLNTLHPLSDTELEKLMREKKIDHRL